MMVQTILLIRVNSVKEGQLQQDNLKAKMVTCSDDPLSFLESVDELTPGRVDLVRIKDRGSKPRQATVSVQGVPASGVIDSGADITIMGPDLFKRVAAAAHLKKSAFQKPDKVPYTYDHQPFTLHGKLELDISFEDVTMRTPVYIKWMPVTLFCSLKVSATSWE